MRRFSFSAIWIILFVANFAYGQTKEITLEDIWKKSKFVPSGVAGFLPMPQGDFYSVTTKESIDKHSFATGDKVATLLTDEELKAASAQAVSLKSVQRYNFDKAEKQLLLASRGAVVVDVRS